MNRVVVPVRYPLTEHSKRTLGEAIQIAEERDIALTILHVDLYHRGRKVTHEELQHAVEAEFDPLSPVRYVVREGFLVEETILEEVAAEEADVVVIGHKQAGRWRQMIQKLTSNPDIEGYLREKLDVEVVTVG